MKEKSSIQVLKEYTQEAFEVLGTDKEKENIKNLKESFKDEIHLTFGCKDCTENKRKLNEWPCTNCSLWQKSPPIEWSKKSRRGWGYFTIYDKDFDFFYRFKHTQIELDIFGKKNPKEYSTEVLCYILDKDDYDIYDSTSNKGRKLCKGIIVDTRPNIVIKVYSFYDEERDSPQVIFIPKKEKDKVKNYFTEGEKIMYASVSELVRQYDLYRKVPKVITTHTKHGKEYMYKDAYVKLELIK